MKLLKKLVGWFLCLIGKHKFRPTYTQRWVEHKVRKHSRKSHIKNQFKCCRCPHKTKWMNQDDTDKFLDEKASWS